MCRLSDARYWPSMLLVASLAASCASHPPQDQFPAHWTLPAPASIGACPDISGQYKNLGETIEGKVTVSLLLELFAEEHVAWANRPFADYPFARQKEVSHVSIQQQRQDSLDITAWKGNEILHSKRLAKDSQGFICEDRWLKIKTTSRGGGNGLLIFQTVTRSFGNSGGFLLERLEYESLEIFIFFPTTSSTVKWHRFARSELAK